MRINTFIIGVLKPLAFHQKANRAERGRKVVNSAGASRPFFFLIYSPPTIFTFASYSLLFLKEVREYGAVAEAVTSLTRRVNPISFRPPSTYGGAISIGPCV